jgi:pimeloyl-ACP methyl ester carboxylesterase
MSPVGAKYGGSACMQFAADNSHRLRSLTLCGSPFRGSGSGNADAIREKGVRQWAAETQRARLGSDASAEQVRWWTDELMGKTSVRAAHGAASARIDMDLDALLPRIAVPTLMVTTQESGLQSIATVQRHAARIPDAQVVVLPGDSFHIAASAPDVCAQHVLRFIDAVSTGHHAPRQAVAVQVGS